MSGLNWTGILMLILAVLFMELFLGINAWYELNMAALMAAIAYLAVGITLSVWPSPSGDEEEA